MNRLELIAIDEVLLCSTWAFSIFVLVRLWESKDGWFRKLLIAYFACEVFENFGVSLYILFYQNAYIIPFIPLALPKACVIYLIYRYLTNKK